MMLNHFHSAHEFHIKDIFFLGFHVHFIQHKKKTINKLNYYFIVPERKEGHRRTKKEKSKALDDIEKEEEMENCWQSVEIFSTSPIVFMLKFIPLTRFLKLWHCFRHYIRNRWYCKMGKKFVGFICDGWSFFVMSPPHNSNRKKR